MKRTAFLFLLIILAGCTEGPYSQKLYCDGPEYRDAVPTGQLDNLEVTLAYYMHPNPKAINISISEALIFDVMATSSQNNIIYFQAGDDANPIDGAYRVFFTINRTTLEYSYKWDDAPVLGAVTSSGKCQLIEPKI